MTTRVFTDEEIDAQLRFLLEHSEPGATIHHLVIVAVDDQGEPHVTLYAIAPTEEVNPEQFIIQTIALAVVKTMKDKVIYFAALAIEGHAVFFDGDETDNNLAQNLLAGHRLEEHPRSFEVTHLYAAALDGRRWTGHRHLTGPTAGQTDGPKVHTDKLAVEEVSLFPRLIRKAVGLE